MNFVFGLDSNKNIFLISLIYQIYGAFVHDPIYDQFSYE